MAIDFFRAPIKSIETFAIRIQIVPERSGLALAQPVHIDQRNQIIQLINPCQRCRFPYAPFGAFAIAEQDISAVIELVQARA